MQSQTLLTTKQVATQLNCSKTFVLDRARNGDIAGLRLHGAGKRTTWRFTQESIDNYLRGCQVQNLQAAVDTSRAVAQQHKKRSRPVFAPSAIAAEAARRGIDIKF